MKIAITGMGCISPLGITVDEFSAGLLGGEVGIRRAPWLADDDPSEQLYGPVHDRFDPSLWMTDKVIAGTDGFAQMALGACAEALAQAGLEDGLDPLRTGVVGGSQMGGSHSLALAQSLYEREGVDAVDPKVVIKMYPNMAASQICMRYGLHGPSLTVATTCATSLDALGSRPGSRQRRRADVVICRRLRRDVTLRAQQRVRTGDGDIGVRYGMDTTATDPRRAMLPFDADDAGIVGAEGCGVLRAGIRGARARPRRRGARLGPGLRRTRRRLPSLVPGPVRSMGAAGDGARAGRCRRRPGDVDALIAHATGTPKGDDAEIKAINDVFIDADRESHLVVTGIKGNTGHTGSATGRHGRRRRRSGHERRPPRPCGRHPEPRPGHPLRCRPARTADGRHRRPPGERLRIRRPERVRRAHTRLDD